MARIQPDRPFPMGLFVASFLLGATNAATRSCYRANGTKQDNSWGWTACNPDLAISPCCGGGDYCLDNGLCLNAGNTNNLYTIQGCTDSSWGAPCQRYCRGYMAENGYIDISICDPANNACCGSACCGTDAPRFQLPVFYDLALPTAQPPINYSLVTLTTNDSPVTLQTPSSSTSSSGTSSALALNVGLGVGLSLGLLLLAALGWIVWGHLRRRQNNHPNSMPILTAKQQTREHENPASTAYAGTSGFRPDQQTDPAPVPIGELPPGNQMHYPAEMGHESSGFRNF